MSNKNRVVITGMGVINSIGHNISQFTESLRQGCCGVTTVAGKMKIGAIIKDFEYIKYLEEIKSEKEAIYHKARKILNNSTYSTVITACTTIQAYLDSNLVEIDSKDIGIIIAGNNINQKYIIDNYKKYLNEPEYINPKYAISFFDTNHIGVISEILNIKGIGYTVGGASASGNIGIYNAYQMIKNGNIKACVCAGALGDLSDLEIQGFQILGAINTDKYIDMPTRASRPFDEDHCGFVLGEGSGTLVLESLESAVNRGARIYGEIVGASINIDGNHLSNPSVEGEQLVMESSINEAEIGLEDIDYINAHGTASKIGDEVEVQAIKNVFGHNVKVPYVNSSKSLVGHCIYSAGVIEIIATIIQMREEFLHPNINLDKPIDGTINFLGRQSVETKNIEYAISNSFGFGGINSCVAIKKA